MTVIGGSGYVGGELLRLLRDHPEVEIHQVSSERFAGRPVKLAHPNLRSIRMRFNRMDELEETDIVLSCLPHGQLMTRFHDVETLAERIIDLSADFRLRSPEAYQNHYGEEHPLPELLTSFIYGIPELHRDEMRNARWISSAGCNATASILPLKPLVEHELIQDEQVVIDVKVGTSESGRNAGVSYSERTGSLRSYRVTGHRHVAEIQQELGVGGTIHFSATSVPIVRGVLATIHIVPRSGVTERELWQVYRDAYGQECFIDIIKERSGNFRYPDPKILLGSNSCHIGFEVDRLTGRVVVLSAIDNLMKGAAGQAVQCMNAMMGWEEDLGLTFPGLYVY